MTPRDAFDDIMSRAQRLLALYDGLVDTRKRAIRRDWRQAFCRLMKWRVKGSIERVDGRDAIIVLKEGATLKRTDFAAEMLDDLLRSALTLAVSALDRYVHERVVRKIVPALRQSKQTTEQQQLEIPAHIAMEIADAVVQDRRVKSNRKFRPANIVRRRMQEVLHQRPFQSWRQIASAFALIGIGGIDGKIQASLREANLGAFKDELNAAIRQRNQIVHEGDLVRHERTGNACVRKHRIQPHAVRSGMDTIRKLVEELEKIG